MVKRRCLFFSWDICVETITWEQIKCFAVSVSSLNTNSFVLTAALRAQYESESAISNSVTDFV